MPNQYTSPKGEAGDPRIDDALRRLLEETPRGMELSAAEIAERVGCSRQHIWYVEQQAVKKLRQRAALLEVFL